MKVFITGHKGVIGSDIMPILERRGHDVVTYDLQDGQDIRDMENLQDAVPDKCDMVIHLANFPHPCNIPAREYKELNVGGTKNLIEACKGKDIGGIIFVSSLAALGWDVPMKKADFVSVCRNYKGEGMYPHGKPPFDEKTKTMPVDWDLEAYGVSKVVQESMLVESGIPYMILRFGPYGVPDDSRGDYYNDAVSRGWGVDAIEKILKGKFKWNQIIHVCRCGMFGGEKLEKFIG